MAVYEWTGSAFVASGLGCNLAGLYDFAQIEGGAAASAIIEVVENYQYWMDAPLIIGNAEDDTEFTIERCSLHSNSDITVVLSATLFLGTEGSGTGIAGFPCYIWMRGSGSFIDYGKVVMWNTVLFVVSGHILCHSGEFTAFNSIVTFAADTQALILYDDMVGGEVDGLYIYNTLKFSNRSTNIITTNITIDTADIAIGSSGTDTFASNIKITNARIELESGGAGQDVFITDAEYTIDESKVNVVTGGEVNELYTFIPSTIDKDGNPLAGVSINLRMDDIVSHGGDKYRSIQTGTNEEPNGETAYWTVDNDITDTVYPWDATVTYSPDNDETDCVSGIYGVVSGDEKIVNGNMEDDSDWVDLNSPDTNERSDTQSYNGTYSRHVVGDVGEGIEQEIFDSLEVGKTYIIRARIYVVSGQAWMHHNSDSSTNTDAVSAASWSYAELLITKGSWGTLRFECAFGSAEFYVDNVSLKEVPTLAMTRRIYRFGANPHSVRQLQLLLTHTDYPDMEHKNTCIEERLMMEIDMGQTTAGIIAAVEASAVDIQKIDGNEDAAANLSDMFDGATGYTDERAPSTQAQIGNLSTGSAAISTTVSSLEDTLPAVVGTPTNDYTSTIEEDEVYHSWIPDGGELEFAYNFNIGPNASPVDAIWIGYCQSNNDEVLIYARNWVGNSWERIETINGTPATTKQTIPFKLTTAHVNTGENSGDVRIRFVSTGGSVITAFGTDRMLLSYTITNQSVGYSNGLIWIDTVAGVAGQVPFVNGTADNPSDNVTDALALSGATGIRRFGIVSGSTITLIADASYMVGLGENWSLEFNSQIISYGSIHGANVSGVPDAGSTDYEMVDCHIMDCSLTPGHLHYSALEGTITMIASGTIIFDGCYSGIAGTDTPTFDFGDTIGVTALNMRHYSGGIKIENMKADDTMSLEGEGQLVIDANCDSGGTIVVRGNFKITGGAAFVAGGGTLDETANITNPGIITTLKESIGWTSGGTWTLQYLLKHLLAKILGKVTLKSGETKIVKVADAEDSTKVQHESTISETTPFVEITSFEDE
ncbi:MAG: hypothetical protein KAS32_25980 [Candidatus Peribacteraceae bacterium]|nr:hypothetical protein [Candidatus Peribacteraceae bacterium]